MSEAQWSFYKFLSLPLGIVCAGITYWVTADLFVSFVIAEGAGVIAGVCWSEEEKEKMKWKEAAEKARSR